MIHVRGLWKSMGGGPVLRDVGLTAPEGQIVSLVGENGAGKTTLLRCLAGALRPDGGAVEFDGQPFDREDVALRRRLFYLPADPVLFEDFTILKHLSMILRLYEADRPGAEAQAVALLREFEILHLAEAFAAGLSRGQLYKAAAVGAVLSGAKYLLFDEPFASGMDPAGIMTLKSRMRAAAAEGRVVVFSTQILDIAEELSSRVCVLSRGEVVASGTIDELRHAVATKSGRLEEIFKRLKEKRG